MKTLSFLKRTGTLLRETYNEFKSDHAIKLSAALSCYTIFSIPPLLIIIISVSGIFLGDETAKVEIFRQINEIVGGEPALQIQQTIKNVKLSGSNAIVTATGIIILLVGASVVFSEIQGSINYIWKIKVKPKRGLLKFIKNSLMTFSMIGLASLLLVIGLLVNSFMDIPEKSLMVNFLWHTVNLFYILKILINYVFITILTTIIFKTLPDGKVALRDCIIGASFTAIFFMIGKLAIGSYLGSSAFASFYGATGSVIFILAWVYYSSIVLFFGAEFTKVYAHTYGEKIVPNENTVRIIKHKRKTTANG